ncbi:S-methyl-5-thioribose-1-phosphate isomerase [Candidatus Nitrososphaera evergladensis SR1]|uniref:Putative methylthioribose-1-phosphate isomerase n=1 Tax=Candidatus Nitrososphaera evergladensis SR1 TaxID=1459636 RepID=A0A075MUR1_9ARCH|nr:S-methyl-5-thioribose-1-phosphate isomerase [Candidatus Nitrososphaera evergladensis]AIF83044.1 S-methyl-5-thioribose-1-phosphate isomerase [Candidatus Nitrososphaera evergladensis SR1]
MAKSKNLDLLLTVEWKDNAVVMIDQTKLPNKLAYVKCTDYHQVADAIKKLVVRGAPAIGVSAALGLALAAQNSKAKTLSELMTDLDTAFKELRATRPTAVNLFWALERVMGKAKRAKTLEDARNIVLAEAQKMWQEDVKANREMGANGARLFQDGDVVLTHCNAGSLATVAYGTALGVIRAARESGKRLSVIATETRPVMQGARLTAFELQHDGVDVSLIPDTAVGHMMARGAIKRVIVGADRVLRTGHVFNKIGTYQVAILASRHKVPFYVAAPLSTFDFESDPKDVVIEERSVDEVVKVGKKRVAPKGVRIFNPAFDMTPPELITGIITERGVLKPPFEKNLKALLG